MVAWNTYHNPARCPKGHPIRPTSVSFRTYPGRRVFANVRNCLHNTVPDPQKQAERVQRYLGFWLFPQRFHAFEFFWGDAGAFGDEFPAHAVA